MQMTEMYANTPPPPLIFLVLKESVSYESTEYVLKLPTSLEYYSY